MVFKAKAGNFGFALDMNQGTIQNYNGWLSGNDMSVVPSNVQIDITAGFVVFQGAKIASPLQTVTFSAAHPTLTRRDMIAFNGTNFEVIEGIPQDDINTVAKPADFNVEDFVIIGFIKVRPAVTEFDSTDIFDYRVYGQFPELPDGAHGDMLYKNGSDWVVLSPDTAGKVLQTKGVGSAPAWESSLSNVKFYENNNSASITNTVVETDLLNVIIPQNDLGTNAILNINSGLHVSQAGAPTRTCTYRLYVDGNLEKTIVIDVAESSDAGSAMLYLIRNVDTTIAPIEIKISAQLDNVNGITGNLHSLIVTGYEL